MRSLFLVVCASLVLAGPAYATAHNADHATNWFEQLFFFGPILALLALALIRKSRLALLTGVASLVVPAVWAVVRVWSMDGPWNMMHLAKHHAELGGFAAIAAILVLCLVLVRGMRTA